MKILFIASELKRFGGIQRYNKIFLQNLTELGEDVKLVERSVGSKSGDLTSKIKFVFGFILEVIKFKPNIIICTYINFSLICYFLKKIFAKEVKRICDKLNVVRPVLRAMPDKIGGRCIVQNCDLLDDWVTKTIKGRNKKY